MFNNRIKPKIDNPKKFQNEMDSFRNRLGKHITWFNALHKDLQWELMFTWKKFKFMNKSTQSISFKKFIYLKQKSAKFFISKQRLRESNLNELIK
jgi:hypothetical protein